jgi:hypothetical protein
MSNQKPCPFCIKGYYHSNDCYLTLISRAQEYERHYPYIKGMVRPTAEEIYAAWNNRPYENEIKADAVREAIDYADCLSHDVIDWIKRIKLYVNKLERGEV